MADIDERPAKVRKLTHDHEPEATPSSVEVNLEQSKADGVLANDAAVKSQIEPAELSDDNSDLAPNNVDALAESQPAIPFQPLSKNQLKKLRKREEWEAGRDYRRAKRRQKIQEKRSRKKEARAEAEADPTSANLKPPSIKHIRLPVTILIDCGFDDLMVEKEMISLGSQLTRAYSDNHRAPFQAHLAISSWGGALKQRFDTVLNKHYLNWRGVRFEDDDFAIVSTKATTWMQSKGGGKLAGVFEKYQAQPEVDNVQPTEPDADKFVSAAEGSDGSSISPKPIMNESSIAAEPSLTNDAKTEQSCLPLAETIYLTSDSPDTLTELKPNSTYIVGGLVDKNRHKGICYKTALDKGVRTAKLPIGEYMSMQSRFVLATNHVVEIMLRWLECGDWGEAFMKVIPKRKGGTLKLDDDEVESE